MRVLPYFAGAATLVAIGGAAMGGAIDTTPRQIFDSGATMPASSGITYDNVRRETPTANHYPLDAGDKRYEVAELRERGLYSQDRYAGSYYREAPQANLDQFDYAAAEADQRQWEAEQRRPASGQRVAYTEVRTAPRRPVDTAKPATANKPAIRFVSQPVVQDTSSMTNR
ncbi:hypothetical protein [Citromicrobium bathyomarinum]|uniref:hypothetical protein n=1 Tax=Citromicrobium bathyomarinum TaxID=72174 RepID=UPI00315AF718